MREIVMPGDKKNALGTALLRWLFEQLERAAREPVLLTGAGDAFSAGLDLREIASLDAAGLTAYLELLERVVARLWVHPGPTVAAVNGHAIAGGCVLALCCDHRVASENPRLKIGLNEVALGVRFPPRVLSIVTARVPAHAVGPVLFGGRLFSPNDALGMGLVDEVSADVGTTARARLAELSRHPPDGYAALKADMRGARVEWSADERVTFLRDVLPAWTAPETRARIEAVLKR